MHDRGEAGPATAKVVLDLCREAGIATLLIPVPGSQNHIIAIDRADATTLLTAIGERHQPWYVSAGSSVAGPLGHHLVGTDPRAHAELAHAGSISLSRYTSEGPRTPARADSVSVTFWTVAADRSLLVSMPTGQQTLRPPGEREVIRVDVGGTVVRSAPTRTAPMDRFPDLPVDVVYTWVDGDDDVWRRRRAAAMADTRAPLEPLPESAVESFRFRSRDELRYSLRSVSAYAPWVRHIWLVTDQQTPRWLNRTVPGLTVVDHRDIFSDDKLPVFNSHAIGARIHTIPGLAEHYLYVNDDVLFGRPVEPALFFASSTMSKFFPSKVMLTPRASPTDAIEGSRLLSQELIAQRFGVSPLNLFRHTPMPLQRSLMYELEETFSELFRRTASSTFRSSDDIIASSWIHHYGGYFLGRTAPGRIDYDYFSTADLVNRPGEFDRLTNCHEQTYCINDEAGADDLSTAVLHQALDKLLPEPSRFEL